MAVNLASCCRLSLHTLYNVPVFHSHQVITMIAAIYKVSVVHFIRGCQRFHQPLHHVINRPKDLPTTLESDVTDVDVRLVHGDNVTQQPVLVRLWRLVPRGEARRSPTCQPVRRRVASEGTSTGSLRTAYTLINTCWRCYWFAAGVKEKGRRIAPHTRDRKFK